MGRANTNSWQYCRPAGVAFLFQPLINIVKPPMGNRACNLLSKDCWRATLADEAEPAGKEVALIAFAFLLTGRGERLAWSAACPHGSVIWPSGETEGKAPSADTGEEVALGVVFKVIGGYFRYAALVHVSGGDEAVSDKLAQHGCGLGVELVVVGDHGF